MRFKRAVQRYGETSEPVTPYQKAAQVWDERLGTSRSQAKNWRLMAFGSLTLSIGLASALIWQGATSRVTPYVVEVDKLGGVQAIAPAIEPYQPTDAQIAYHLARFVRDVRSLSIDPIVVRRNWLEAYDFTTDRAAQTLNDFARAADPFKSVGERTVSVEVTSVVRASPESFQIKWTEQSWKQGSRERTERWTGILTVVVQQPRSADTLRKNPLGIYIHGLDWSRELNVGEAQ